MPWRVGGSEAVGRFLVSCGQSTALPHGYRHMPAPRLEGDGQVRRGPEQNTPLSEVRTACEPGRPSDRGEPRSKEVMDLSARLPRWRHSPQGWGTLFPLAPAPVGMVPAHPGVPDRDRGILVPWQIFLTFPRGWRQKLHRLLRSHLFRPDTPWSGLPRDPVPRTLSTGSFASGELCHHPENNFGAALPANSRTKGSRNLWFPTFIHSKRHPGEGAWHDY